MEHKVINLTFVLTMYLIMTFVLIFPGIVFFEVWRLPSFEKWKIYKKRRLIKKSKLAEEKLKKYLEIDITKLK